ncbi:hypothetical protein F5X96DRAFT_601004 [Biscogniauxia mediterranea]|nr:hypothetical protein F5X96DRAFT_601004 [Biscogniauxia mediterranea]
MEGKPNGLIARVRNTEFFKPILDELDSMMKPELYIGRSVEIFERYCGGGIGPVEKALASYEQYLFSVDHYAAKRLNWLVADSRYCREELTKVVMGSVDWPEQRMKRMRHEGYYAYSWSRHDDLQRATSNYCLF